MELQRRSLSMPKLELRNKDSRTIGGLAIPYSVDAELYPGFKEVFLPGSVKVHKRGCLLLWFHGLGNLLASTRTSRLRLSDQPDGVYFEAELPDTQLGKDLVELVALGEVQGVSPGFHIVEQRIAYDKDSQTRQIIKASLGEISLTYMPAYVTTQVELRNGGTDFADEMKQLNERRSYMAALRAKEMSKLNHQGEKA